MTARIVQSVVPRTPSNFRASLRFASHIKPSRRKSSFSSKLAFRVRPLGRQLGSIDHQTISLSLGLLALVTVALLGFFYLQQVVSTASQGGDISNLENQISQLKEHQHQLELQGAELRSIKTIENNVQKLNLVTTNKVSYLSDTSGSVALAGPTATSTAH